MTLVGGQAVAEERPADYKPKLAQVEDSDEDELATSLGSTTDGPARVKNGEAMGGAPPAGVSSVVGDRSVESGVDVDSSSDSDASVSAAVPFERGSHTRVAERGAEEGAGVSCRPEEELELTRAEELKVRGNACVARGDFREAVVAYNAALTALQQGVADPLRATRAHPRTRRDPATSPSSPAAVAASVLHSNLSLALVSQGHASQARQAALEAAALRPDWFKPHSRLAEAEACLRRWGPAVDSAERAAALARGAEAGRVAAARDAIALRAALDGSSEGFRGRQLEVRAAGDEAWLGGPAPHDAALDGPAADEGGGVGDGEEADAQEGVLKRLEGFESDGVAPAPSARQPRLPARSSQAAITPQTRTSFRSLSEALEHARDGDRILLRRGAHNGMGEAADVRARVLVEGEGALGETVLDQRANSPSFRVSRPGVCLRRLVVDHTGFCQALHVSGDEHVQPLFVQLDVRCSGDDAVNVAGAARPVFAECTFQAKSCGVRVYDDAEAHEREDGAAGGNDGRETDEQVERRQAALATPLRALARSLLEAAPFEQHHSPLLLACVFQSSGASAAHVSGRRRLALRRCRVLKASEDGVVCMESACVALEGCLLHDCAGPGVDLSGSARAVIVKGEIRGCQGGVWAWDRAQVLLDGVRLEGGGTHALLTDQRASMALRACALTGSAHGQGALRALAQEGAGRQEPAGRHTGWPVEDGPFRFVPNPYTRKQ